MNFESIAIYAIVFVARIFDSISTIWLLKYVDDTEEAMPLSRRMQEIFGLYKGEIVNAGLFLFVITPLLLREILRKDIIFLGWLLSGIYLGVALKQLQNGFSAREAEQKCS